MKQIALRVVTLILILMTLTAPVQAQAPVQPYPDAPLCPDHDDRAYHGLWDAVRGCHYDHEHGDDPRVLDAVFGTDLFQDMGGEISYPWETHHENMMKHETYKWFVKSDESCYAAYSDGCVKYFRTLAHSDAFNVTSDYHSYVVEAYVCREADLNDCGYMRIGGWQFTGDLTIDRMTAYNRDERTYAPRAPRPVMNYHDQDGQASFSAWYLTSPYGWARVAVHFIDMWGYFKQVPAPVSSPTLLTYEKFCDYDEVSGAVPANCINNSSHRKPEIVAVNITPYNLRQIGQYGLPYANYNGYVDQYGVIAPACTAVGPTCIPLVIRNFPTGVNNFQFNGSRTDYDIYFNGLPSGWINYPN